MFKGILFEHLDFIISVNVKTSKMKGKGQLLGIIGLWLLYLSPMLSSLQSQHLTILPHPSGHTHILTHTHTHNYNCGKPVA